MIKDFLHLIFPRRCLQCSQRIFESSLYCLKCQKECQLIANHEIHSLLCFDHASCLKKLIFFYEKTYSQKALETLAALITLTLLQKNLWNFDFIFYIKKNGIEEDLCYFLHTQYKIAKKVCFRKEALEDSKIVIIHKERIKEEVPMNNVVNVYLYEKCEG